MRRLWPLFALTAALVLLLSLPGYLQGVTTAPHSGGIRVEPGSLAFVLNLLSSLLSFGAASLSLALAFLVFRRRSDDSMALFLSYYMLAHGVIVAGPFEMLEPLLPGIAELSVTVLSPAIMGPASIALLALFPDGRFVPRWTKPVTYASILFVPLSLLVGTPELTDPLTLVMVSLLYLAFFGTAAAMVYAQVYRHRHVSTPLQRQQTKWFVFGFGLWLAMAAISSVPYMYLDSLPAGSPYPQWVPAAAGFWWLATAALPVSLTMAITRSRLYEIDLIINRTLVYGALTASVIAIYALVVGGLGLVFQASGNTLVSLVATGLVAVLFQPLRERLQRRVNRLTYGAREDPVAVLTSLGRQLEETVSPQAALDGIVQTVADHLKLPFSAIEFEDSNATRPAASYGQMPAHTVEFPIIYQTERVGRLVVAPRSPQEDLNQSDEQLLQNIASQAGATAKAAKLATDLQRSRQQLVAAREEERRRLRRDLHDGLGPQLASQTLTLDALEKRLAKDPQAAAELVRSLKEQSRSAVRDIRQLVYNLRPPALDELGLAGALRQVTADQHTSQTTFHVHAADDLPPLPAAIEVAGYRIAQEAITNVVRHAESSRCSVSLQAQRRGEQHWLVLKVIDDGRGMAVNKKHGVGLASMRERAEELGGSLSIDSDPGQGTRVMAQLPFPAEQSL